jgi:hypothetical protein
MNEIVEARVTYTPEDFMRHAAFMQSRIGLAKKVVFFTLAIFASIFLFLYFANSAKFITAFAKPQNILIFVTAGLLVIGIFILKKYTSKFFLRRSLEKQIKSTPALSVPQHFSFDDEGFYGTNEFASGQLNWQAMVEMVETEEDFYFFMSKNFARFVPKRFFSDEQLNQIRELAKRNLGDKAKF